MAFSPDGKHLLLGTEHGSAMLWDAGSGRLVQTFEHTKVGEHTTFGRDVTVVFSPDGTRVLTGGRGEKTAKLWDAATGQLIQSFGESTEGIDKDLKWVSLAFSPDGTRVLTGPKGYGNRVVASGNTSLSLWEVATGRLIRTMEGDPRGVAFAAFSQDGTLIVTSGDKRGHNALNFWDLETGRLIRTRGFVAEGELVPFTVLAISDDGARVVSGGRNDWLLRADVLRLWDVPTGRMLHAFVGQVPVHSVAVSSDGTLLLSGVGDKSCCGDTIGLWEAATGRLASSKSLESSSHATVGFSPGGARAVSLSRTDSEFKLLDALTGEHIRSFDISGDRFWYNSATLSPDGTRLVAVGDGAGSREFKLWDVATGQIVRTQWCATAAVEVAFSPDGARIVWTYGKMLTLLDAVTDSHLRTLDARPMEAIGALALSPDSSRILSAGTILSYGRPPAKVVLWDVTTGHLIRIFGRHSAQAR